MPQTLHLPPKSPNSGGLRSQNPPGLGGGGGGSGNNLGLLRGLEFTFLRNLRFLKNVGNDKVVRMGLMKLFLGKRSQ